MKSTDLKAEQLGAKMMEDEQRIGDVVARANETRDGVSKVFDKVVEMHAGIKAMKKELESTIKHNEQEATMANESLRRDAAIRDRQAPDGPHLQVQGA